MADFASHLRFGWLLASFTIGTDLHRCEILALIHLLILCHRLTRRERPRSSATHNSRVRRRRLPLWRPAPPCPNVWVKSRSPCWMFSASRPGGNRLRDRKGRSARQSRLSRASAQAETLPVIEFVYGSIYRTARLAATISPALMRQALAPPAASHADHPRALRSAVAAPSCRYIHIPAPVHTRVAFPLACCWHLVCVPRAAVQ